MVGNARIGDLETGRVVHTTQALPHSIGRVALDKSEDSVKAKFSRAVPEHRCVRQRG